MSDPGPNSPIPHAHVEVTRGGPAKPWLGQLVPVDVDVWRPEPEGVRLEPFSLDDVVAAGMIVKWSEHASPPDERQVGDTRFLIQHRTLLAFPESDGELVVPPVVARWTDPSTHSPVVAKSAELRFTAAVPPGASGELPVVASSLTLEQKLDRDSGLRVGDGFTRTLTLHATDTDPIVFPELVLSEPSGMTGYAAGSRAASNTEHGQIQADLTLRVTYVIDRVGPHRLAGASVRWLEPRSGRYLEAAVPDVTIWAAPNPSLGFQCLGTARGAALATGLGGLALLVLLAWAVVRRLRHGPGRWERALEERSRERLAFHEAMDAARQGPAALALQKIYDWLAVRQPRALERSLTPLRTATAEASVACTQLEEQVFRDGKSPAPGAAFVGMLRRARSAMGRAPSKVALDSLNPERADEGGS